MNKILYISIFSLIISSALAQSDGFRLLCSEEIQLPLLIHERDSQLHIDSQMEDKHSKRILRVGAHLSDADLIVEVETAHQIHEAYYQIQLHMVTPYGIKISPELHETEGSTTLSPGSINKLSWLDFAENLLQPGRRYSLVIVSHLYSKATLLCEQGPPPKPLENSMIRNIYLGSAIIGSGLLTAGLIQRGRALSSHDEYVESWRNGQSEEEASIHYEDADSQNKSYKGLATSGGIILGVGALLLLNDFRKHWRAKKTFIQSCCGSPGIRLQPEISQSFASAELTLGLSLKLSF